MQSKKYSERMFKQALSSSQAPGEQLNRELKAKMEAKNIMEKANNGIVDRRAQRRTGRVKRPMAAAIALAVLLCSATAYAAWHLLKPSDVAQHLQNDALAAAFQSEDATMINESQSQSGYDVTLLGMVSGKGLTGFNEDVDTDKTYAVVATTRQDGQPMADSEELFISPLIKGLEPWRYNIASMGGGYSYFVQDGTRYTMIECDNVEMFADKGLKLCVSSTAFYDVDAFDYDAQSGEVSPKQGYDGLNLLFDLPIDASKADPQKAEQYVAGLWQEQPADEATEQPEDNTVNSEGKTKVMDAASFKAWMAQQQAQLQELVDKGDISAETMEVEMQGLRELLKDIENGKRVELIEYGDGGYGMSVTEPASGDINTEIMPDGSIQFSDK